MQYQKEEVRKRILEAGKEEYLSKGYRAGKISTIAQAAGVPIGNLYRYFDGKSGLLDAIVKDVYTLIPRYVAEIASVNQTKDMNLAELATALTKVIMDLFDRCGKEILILMDKCEGSRYEDFNQKLYGLVCKYLDEIIFKSKTKEDQVFCSVIAQAFLDMIMDILRKGDRQLYASLIKRLLIFCFYEAENRI